MNFPNVSYYISIIHLMIAIPMLVVDVPFGKWSHFLYRPLATYLSAVKLKATAIHTWQG